MKKYRGFTLLEVLVVTAIVVILAAVAVPNFTETTKRNRMAANANELLSLVQLARAEALRRGGKVILASTGGSDWADGALLFSDDTRDQAYVANEDEEIRVFQTVGQDVTVTPLRGVAGLAFDSRGFVTLLSPTNSDDLDNGALEVFRICDNRVGETGRDVHILISGSVFIAETDDCS